MFYKYILKNEKVWSKNANFNISGQISLKLEQIISFSFNKNLAFCLVEFRNKEKV